MNYINYTPLLVTRRIHKTAVDLNLNTLMYLKKRYNFTTRMTRKQWTRRKHFYAWLAYSNLLKDWARSYRFHRTGLKLTYYQFFTKYSFLAFNLVIARNSIPALHKGSEDILTGNFTKRFLYFFNTWSISRFNFLSSFKHVQLLTISLNPTLSTQQLQHFFENQTAVVPLYIDTLNSLLPWKEIATSNSEVKQTFSLLLYSIFSFNISYVIILYKFLVVLGIQRINFYFCP